MPIVECIEAKVDEYIKNFRRAPTMLYLGHLDVIELNKAGTVYGLYKCGDDRTTWWFRGLTIIPVEFDNYVAVH